MFKKIKLFFDGDSESYMSQLVDNCFHIGFILDKTNALKMTDTVYLLSVYKGRIKMEKNKEYKSLSDNTLSCIEIEKISKLLSGCKLSSSETTAFLSTIYGILLSIDIHVLNKISTYDENKHMQLEVHIPSLSSKHINNMLMNEKILNFTCTAGRKNNVILTIYI